MLSAFDTRILATDMFPVDKPECVEALWPADRLDDLLAAVDILVLCLPLNDPTRGMIDAAEAGEDEAGRPAGERGPRAAGGRRPTWSRPWRAGHLAGAVMDVTDPEPLPPDSRLWDMPNVIITPHVGGQSAWRIDNMTDLFCRNLRRWQAGLPLMNYLADKRLGFPIRGGGYPLWGESV